MKRKRKFLKFTDQDRVNLKNALYNLTPHSGASADYCEGMVLGIVALGMAQGLEFDQALDLVAEHFPDWWPCYRAAVLDRRLQAYARRTQEIVETVAYRHGLTVIGPTALNEIGHNERKHMIRHIIDDEHQRYTRISKREARKLFDAGTTFYIIAHKMRPGMPFSMGMTIDGAHYAKENAEIAKHSSLVPPMTLYTFDSVVQNFCWYNANCHETGTYAAFYTVTERKAVTRA